MSLRMICLSCVFGVRICLRVCFCLCQGIANALEYNVSSNVSSCVLMNCNAMRCFPRIKAWLVSAVLWGNPTASISIGSGDGNQDASSLLPKSRTSLWQGSCDLIALLQEKKTFHLANRQRQSQGQGVGGCNGNSTHGMLSFDL